MAAINFVVSGYRTRLMTAVKHVCFASAIANHPPVNKLDLNYPTLRAVPKTTLEYKSQNELISKPIEQPAQPRILKVSILGVPNVGKSTLTNRLIGWRVCPVSKKVHTTRNNSAAVLTVDNTQIIFLDTPGLISVETSQKHHLEQTLVTDPRVSLQHADLILVVIDGANQWTRRFIDPMIIELLEIHKNKKSALVINKCDAVKGKEILLTTTRKLTCGKVGGTESAKVTKPLPIDRESHLKQIFELTEQKVKTKLSEEQGKPERGWPHFETVFMVSALNGDGIENIVSYLSKNAISGPWIYPPNIVTNEDPQELAILTLREKLLDNLPKEIPYNLDVSIEMWELEKFGMLRIAMCIHSKKPHWVQKIIGNEGKVIGTITKESKQELENMFRCDVSLKLIVKT